MVDADGVPCTAWSVWQISGLLNILAGTTSNSRFVITLDSLSAPDQPGTVADFNPLIARSWR